MNPLTFSAVDGYDALVLSHLLHDPAFELIRSITSIHSLQKQHLVFLAITIVLLST